MMLYIWSFCLKTGAEHGDGSLQGPDQGVDTSGGSAYVLAPSVESARRLLADFTEWQARYLMGKAPRPVHLPPGNVERWGECYRTVAEARRIADAEPTYSIPVADAPGYRRARIVGVEFGYAV